MEPVVVREYPDQPSFVADATKLAADGYKVATQSSGNGGLSNAGKVWFALSAVMAVAGFAMPLLWIVAIVMLLVAVTGRRKRLMVTYQL